MQIPKLSAFDYQYLATFYKLFSSETRLKIILELFEKPMCVNDLAQKLQMTQTAISHQLKELRLNRIVRFEKRGQSVLYSLTDTHIVNIIVSGTQHIKGENCDA